jgi:hypothetical protein
VVVAGRDGGGGWRGREGVDLSFIRKRRCFLPTFARRDGSYFPSRTEREEGVTLLERRLTRGPEDDAKGKGKQEMRRS